MMLDRSQLDSKGWSLASGAVSEDLLVNLEPLFDRISGAGTRIGLLDTSIRLFLRHPIVRELAESALSRTAVCVRAILFDKSPVCNWKVPFHQDLSAVFAEPSECCGYGPWTQKEGLWHAIVPASLLERMVALRVHFDPTDRANGALAAIEGSHRFGRLSAKEIEALVSQGVAQDLIAERGDVLGMKPLILHASNKAQKPIRRRVLHLEFCDAEPPIPLRWHETALVGAAT